MARNTRIGRIYNRFDRTFRNVMGLDKWPGVRPWNKQPTPISSSQDFDYVDLEPREYYVGQLYGAIRTRATRVADLAKEHTKTRLFDDPEQEIEDQHPYLQLINESPGFANTYFWKAMSTYLDLPGGTAFVFVLRNHNDNIVGAPQEFQIINPYHLTKVIRESNSNEYRYIERRADGSWREIPEKQLIIVRSFNPFNMKEGYGATEAVKDDQFSIQQARSYSRQAIRDNVGQRGMLTPQQVLSDEDYKNFDAAVAGKANDGKGKFLMTNAPVDYKDMQIDLDKLALETVNKLSMETLIAVTGASRTLLGIEDSDVSQEASKTQRELFTENHGIPQLTDILDQLNQDYKNNYPVEYGNRKLELYVDSPLRIDKDRELKEVQIDKTKAEAAKIFIETGYSAESVSEYLELGDELEFEERQPKFMPLPSGDEPKEEEPEDKELGQALNQFPSGMTPVVKGYESTLANQVTNIENQMYATIIPKLADRFAKNAQSDTLTKSQQEKYEKDLTVAIAAFTAGIVTLLATQTSRARFAEFALPTEFTVTPTVNKTIQAAAKRSAASHVSTFLKASLQEARKAGLEGLAREQITSRLTARFEHLSKVNATRIARTESYKAVNLAQFEADKQFLAQNGIEKQAYKKWVVQSKNPCPNCVEMSRRPAVPFGEPFLELGDSIKSTIGGVTREQVASYESIESGTLHPNCSCTYELIVKGV